MAEGVSAVVAAARYVTADEADPEVCFQMASRAFVETSVSKTVALAGGSFAVLVLGEAAHRTTCASPFLEAGTVEDMLAEDCEKAG